MVWWAAVAVVVAVQIGVGVVVCRKVETAYTRITGAQWRG